MSTTNVISLPLPIRRRSVEWWCCVVVGILSAAVVHAMDETHSIAASTPSSSPPSVALQRTFPLPIAVKAYADATTSSGLPVAFADGNVLVPYLTLSSSMTRSAVAWYRTNDDHAAAGDEITVVTATAGATSAGGGGGSSLTLLRCCGGDGNASSSQQMEDSILVVGAAMNPSSSGMNGSFAQKMTIASSYPSSSTVQPFSTTAWWTSLGNATAPSSSILVVENLNIVVYVAPDPTSHLPSAHAVTAISAVNGSILWRRSFGGHPPPTTPVFLSPFVYYMHDQVLYRADPFLGTVTTFMDICNVSASLPSTSGISWNLAVVTYWVTADGTRRDQALIAFANTTAATAVETTTICRWSTNENSTQWTRVESEAFVVEDVIGGGGNVFLSGHRISNATTTVKVLVYNTLVFDAGSGYPLPFPYVRMPVDSQSFPRVLPQALPNCIAATMIQQLGGVAVAYCAEQPWNTKWTSEEPCYHIPLILSLPSLWPLAWIGCTDFATSISLLSATTGEAVWKTPFPVSQPLATDGTTSLFAVDLHARLTQFGFFPHETSSSSSAGIGDSQRSLTNGEVAMVAVFVTFGTVSAILAVWRTVYLRRRAATQRLRAQRQSLTRNDEDGSQYGAIVSMNEKTGFVLPDSA